MASAFAPTTGTESLGLRLASGAALRSATSKSITAEFSVFRKSRSNTECGGGGNATLPMAISTGSGAASRPRRGLRVYFESEAEFAP
ncbi:hypothetical protein CH282_01615 [Rhodococcus sp. 06-418-1B]|nr:hypothetical protein CH282_01615 [Rhodococcus sp. 06-418-1B]